MFTQLDIKIWLKLDSKKHFLYIDVEKTPCINVTQRITLIKTNDDTPKNLKPNYFIASHGKHFEGELLFNNLCDTTNSVIYIF